MTKKDEPETQLVGKLGARYPTGEHLRAQNEQTHPSTGKPLNPSDDESDDDSDD